MLPFNTTHALTGCLIDAETSAHRALGDTYPPLLLVLLDRPARHRRNAGDRREIQAVAMPSLSARTLAAPAPLPQLLQALATTITAAGIPRGTRRTTHPASRVLACAVLYHDISVDDDTLQPVRRTDAVDIDDRTYRITRQHGDRQPVVLIDEQPDPQDTPATLPGLTAVLAAFQELTATNPAGELR